MHKLVIEDDEGRTTIVPLLRDDVSIGRNEGNSIRLTERNVSRRHARLLRQDGALMLEDLNSYNGIRVNGLRIQGRTPLTEGDRIQIGDYMLALQGDTIVEAGPSRVEDVDEKLIGPPPEPLEGPPTEQIHVASLPSPRASPQTQAQAQTQPTPLLSPDTHATTLRDPVRHERPRSRWAAVSAVVIAFVAALGVLKWLGTGNESENEVSVVARSPAADTSSSAETQAGRPNHSDEVKQILAAEDWEAALAICDRVLAGSPQDSVCVAARAHAQSEREAKIAFLAVRTALDRGDLPSALRRLREIPNGSVYESRGQADYEKARSAYVEASLVEMEAAARAGRCDEVRKLGDEIAKVDEDNRQLARIWKLCETRTHVSAPVAVASARRVPSSVPASASTPTPTPIPTPTPVSMPTFDSAALNDLLTEAENAYVRGDHQAAIGTARQVIHMQAGNSKAWRIIGVSSCYLKDSASALDAYERLQANNRQLLQYVCERNGVTLP